jgi:hypothetical protein
MTLKKIGLKRGENFKTLTVSSKRTQKARFTCENCEYASAYFPITAQKFTLVPFGYFGVSFRLQFLQTGRCGLPKNPSLSPSATAETSKVLKTFEVWQGGGTNSRPHTSHT